MNKTGKTFAVAAFAFALAAVPQLATQVHPAMTDTAAKGVVGELLAYDGSEGGAARLSAGEGGASRLAAGEGGAARLAAGEGGASRLAAG
ncbi:MAG TPA: hypothetical protein VGC80_03135, partial [Acetobacteraceae bacterium]